MRASRSRTSGLERTKCLSRRRRDRSFDDGSPGRPPPRSPCSPPRARQCGDVLTRQRRPKRGWTSSRLRAATRLSRFRLMECRLSSWAGPQAVLSCGCGGWIPRPRARWPALSGRRAPSGRRTAARSASLRTRASGGWTSTAARCERSRPKRASPSVAPGTATGPSSTPAIPAGRLSAPPPRGLRARRRPASGRALLGRLARRLAHQRRERLRKVVPHGA